jgi:hypothetical protein
LSLKDLWYKRFVYNVFKDRILFPDIDVTEKNKDIFPNYLFNKALQNYIREAERVIPIQIYKCVLKLKEVEEEEIIYFSSYLLLGISSDVEILKSNNEKSKKTSNYDYMDFFT